MKIQVHSDLGVGLAHWGDLALPRRFSADFDEPGRPFTVSIVVEVRSGQPLCTRLEAQARDDEAIIGETIGRVPVAQYVRIAAATAAMSQNADGSYSETSDLPAVEEALRGVGRRRYVITDEHLREVAKIYDAQLSTGAPVRAVAEHFNTSPKNASKWVKAARERGFVQRGYVGGLT